MPDPNIILWIFVGCISICSFMIGLHWARYRNDYLINETIMYLIHNNYIRAKKVDGEWEILELDKK